MFCFGTEVLLFLYPVSWLFGFGAAVSKYWKLCDLGFFAPWPLRRWLWAWFGIASELNSGLKWDQVCAGNLAWAYSSAVCYRGEQKIGFHCIENVFILKIKLQTAHFAFHALFPMTDVRVSVGCECEEMYIWDENPFFTEKLLLKDNFWLSQWENLRSETLVQWKPLKTSVTHWGTMQNCVWWADMSPQDALVLGNSLDWACWL